ncbi:MAG TPA: hypothetical protein VI750_07135 [Pyrinomonadaceae bacterium]|nr:hypothetical protein [Pyrinomonadaceae bacterium]
MPVRESIQRSMLILTVALVTTYPTFAQIKSSVATPDEKPRKVRAEANRIYKEWPKNDVALIITGDELRAHCLYDSDRQQGSCFQG